MHIVFKEVLETLEKLHLCSYDQGFEIFAKIYTPLMLMEMCVAEET